jgi:hypothetical protein
MATMIGSMPHRDPQEAVELVFQHLPEAPVWPELPMRSFWEDMVHAHTQGLPCLIEDPDARRCFVDTGRGCEDELASFYERSLAAEQSDDLSAFALDARHASALDATLDRLKREPGRGIIKVQCIGPVSFQLQLNDENDRPLYYNDTFQDVLARQVTLQARWLVRRFAPLVREVIAFMDEPSLAAFGSSGYLGVSREEVIERLGRSLAVLKKEGAVTGVHVCGNTDWPMILEAGADIINFDAYEYGRAMLVYFKEVQQHLDRGGFLAWGIVPNSDRIREETVKSLQERLLGLVDGLASQGLDRQQVLSQSILTPACGLGPMPREDAERVVQVLSKLVDSIRSSLP